MSDEIRFETRYLGFELYNGTYQLLVELENQEFAGIIIPGGLISEVSLANITSITFSHSRKGTLNEWELSPNRKQVVAVASQVEDRCAEVCAISVLGLTAAGIVSIFFPPAIVLVPPLTKTAGGSFAIGAGSGLVSKTSRQVKYATITCEASVPTNKVDATCPVPVSFVGRMQTKHLENLYSQWKNQTAPAPVGDTNEAGTALACLPPTQGDFLGTTTVAWERA